MPSSLKIDIWLFLKKVQKELREAMAQLDAIRHEVRSGMSIMQPRPLVRESFEDPGARLQQGSTLNPLKQAYIDYKEIYDSDVVSALNILVYTFS